MFRPISQLLDGGRDFYHIPMAITSLDGRVGYFVPKTNLRGADVQLYKTKSYKWKRDEQAGPFTMAVNHMISWHYSLLTGSLVSYVSGRLYLPRVIDSVQSLNCETG